MGRTSNLCKYGHVLSPDNLVPSMLKRQRRCLICFRAACKEYKRRKRRADGVPIKGPHSHCGRGHELAGANLKVKPDGRRVCATCHRDGERERNRRNGSKPARRLTRLQKLEQRRKWEATRRARKRERFVEMVDPGIVFERGMGLCGICGIAVDRNAFEVDHIVPLARGGEHSYANVQPAHARCNRRKWALKQQGDVTVPVPLG